MRCYDQYRGLLVSNAIHGNSAITMTLDVRVFLGTNIFVGTYPFYPFQKLLFNELNCFDWPQAVCECNLFANSGSRFNCMCGMVIFYRMVYIIPR